VVVVFFFYLFLFFKLTIYSFYLYLGAHDEVTLLAEKLSNRFRNDCRYSWKFTMVV